MSRVVVGIAAAAVYLVLIASIAPADVVTGLVLGAALAAAVPRRSRRGGTWRGTPRFAVGAVQVIARGAWQVLKVLVGAAPSTRAGFVSVDRGERTRDGVLVNGLVMTMSPGTVFVGLDRDGKRLLFTAIDASDPEAVQAEIDAFYQSSQRGSVP
ncbi:MAG TPA: Na+/H+ antiporter subunit E [Polyangiaceae bacterium LLY-WYZ-14_1]|nr:Na+/H+ antiporter subunit E [Polyangiaceae bacterium LLY-WYZ-14_1]